MVWSVVNIFCKAYLCKLINLLLNNLELYIMTIYQSAGNETYITPAIEVIVMQCEQCLAGSPALEDVGNTNDEIEW